MTKNKVNDAIKKLLNMFESGELPKAISRAIIKKQKGDSPSNNWSLGNLMIKNVTLKWRFKQCMK